MVTTLLAMALVLTVLLCAFLLAQRRASTDEPRQVAAPSRAELAPQTETPSAPILGPEDVMLAPTDDPSQFFALGPVELVSQLGTTTETVPRGMLDAAVTVNGLVKAAQAAGELSGRLVLVDGKTAEGIRQGLMMKDAAGAMVGVVRGSGGRISNLSRLRPLGGTAVSAGVSLPTALSAMAMQAQLARMEKAIASVDAHVQELNWKFDAERESAVRATTATLSEAYRISEASGHLDEVTWQQIAPLAHTVFQQQDYARRRLERAIRKIKRLRRANVSDRARDLRRIFEDELPAAIAGLTVTNRHYLQFQALRVWRLSEVNSPTLSAHLAELSRAMESQPDPLEIREAILAAVRSHPSLNAFEKLRNPFAKGELRRSRAGALQFISDFDWYAITMVSRPAEGSARELALEHEEQELLQLPDIAEHRSLGSEGEQESDEKEVLG